MQKTYKNIIDQIKCDTDRIILFSSITGKDSICLTDILCKNFKQVISIYLYTIKDLSFILRYQKYFESRYNNIKYHHFPHFVLHSWHKNGLLGCEKKKVPNIPLSKISELMKQHYGIDYAVIGFKKSDSINRRIMLNEIEKDNYIHPSTKNCYPLSEYNNKFCFDYIKQNKLITPLNFNPKLKSNDCDPMDIHFLLYCEKNSKDDLNKIISIYPETQIKLKMWHDENG